MLTVFKPPLPPPWAVSLYPRNSSSALAQTKSLLIPPQLSDKQTDRQDLTWYPALMDPQAATHNMLSLTHLHLKLSTTLPPCSIPTLATPRISHKIIKERQKLLSHSRSRGGASSSKPPRCKRYRWEVFLDQDVIGTSWMWAGLRLQKECTLAPPGTAEQSKALVQRKVPFDC